ncbi:nuclear transport factor 2 family protein [Nocardia sp. NPDC052254]|uniref:nuclear transport factor 2 family protein n=1 Tax=Nocardia sp. NPDC052254 TaxID=3155681 RepID=UPI003443DBB1
MCGEAPAPDFADLERRILTAIFERDKAGMAELMHSGGYGFDATMGLVGQRALIDGIDALADGAGYAADEIRVVPAGADVTALTYRLRQWGEFGGTPLPPVVFCSSVWRRDAAGWQAVFHHETPAAPA